MRECFGERDIFSIERNFATNASRLVSYYREWKSNDDNASLYYPMTLTICVVGNVDVGVSIGVTGDATGGGGGLLMHLRCHCGHDWSVSPGKDANDGVREGNNEDDDEDGNEDSDEDNDEDNDEDGGGDSGGRYEDNFDLTSIFGGVPHGRNHEEDDCDFPGGNDDNDDNFVVLIFACTHFSTSSTSNPEEGSLRSTSVA